MDILATKIIAVFVLPPGVNLVLAGAGLVALARRRPRLGGALVFLSFAILLAVSLPAVGKLSYGDLVVYPALRPDALDVGGARAIVVLAGGRYANAPEYGADTVSRDTLVRIRYAAWLERRTGLPILVSGGSLYHQPTTEGALMAKVLRDEFGVPVRWIEDQSRNTEENAVDSARVLRREGIHEIVLVTQAPHMRRAVQSFEHTGLVVHPAPTEFLTRPGPTTWDDWLPSAGAVRTNAALLHEWVGSLWYRIRYWR